MKTPRLLCGLLLGGSSLTALACEQPALPAISAEEEIGAEIDQIQADMQRYASEMAAYVACIQAELDAAGGDAAPPMQRTLLVRRNNEAVAEAEYVAELFAERVGTIEEIDPQRFANASENLEGTIESTPSAADQLNEVADRESVVCLSMNRVRDTHAIDDRTVLFFLRGGDIYLNVLEMSCPGLRRNNRFSYSVRTGARIPRLCETDSITVVEQSGGFTCGLGPFELISETQANALMTGPDAVNGDRTIEIETLELPDDTPDEAGDEEKAETAE